MSKTVNKFFPEVRERAVRLVLDNEHEHTSRWTAIESISAKACPREGGDRLRAADPA